MAEVIWKLRHGADRRFRAGHPWVYSNELSSSPKGISPGQRVMLADSSGKFLARGYGNPHSLIAFRALSRDESEVDPLSAESVVRRLVQADSLRSALGFSGFSHRLCFGEADFLPGLVIDRYFLQKGQVFCVQAHTAGAQAWVTDILAILRELVSRQGSAWDSTAVILRNDLGVRKLEGLEPEEARVLKPLPGTELTRADILLRALEGKDPLSMRTDLVGGQKTGFFLDQSANLQLAYRSLATWARARGELRLLDLCCYVGHWGAQLGRAFSALGVKVHVAAVDASAKALELAKHNVELQAGASRCETLRGDVLKDLAGLDARSFDLVISDPPALIQSRKDIPAGEHAYLQLNTQAIRVLKPGGALIACSCSALLEEARFLESLAKATRRNQTTLQWVSRGAQSPDHPMLAEFPEGRYLKCWIGLTGLE